MRHIVRCDRCAVTRLVFTILCHALNIRRQQALDFNLRASFTQQIELQRTGVRQVNNPVGMKRTTVINADDDLFAIGKISHSGIRRDRQGRMGCGDFVHIVRFTRRSTLSMKLFTIPASNTALNKWCRIINDRRIGLTEYDVGFVGGAGIIFNNGDRIDREF